MHRRAVTHLKRVDPALARVIELVGPCRWEVRAEGTHFDAILRAIVGQQLSTKAAAAIYRKVQGLYGGRTPLAAELLATPDDTLRAAGLSWAKIKYAKDLATHTTAGTLPVDRLHELSDSEVMEALTQVKGIGRWTAQMVLMFRLGRPDVLPDLDLAIRKAVHRAYGLRKLPTPDKVLAIGRDWTPYASVASWYLWRSLELEPALKPAASKPKKRRAPARRR